MQHDALALCELFRWFTGIALWSVVSAASAVDIDTLWEYDDPASSEAKFRDALVDAGGDQRLELLTQIERTCSLLGRCDEAHRALDAVEPALAKAGASPRVRYLLERGRTFNSSGNAERARPLFVDAWKLALAVHLDGLAVDARAHARGRV